MELVGNPLLRKGFWFWLVAFAFILSVGFFMNPYFKMRNEYLTQNVEVPIFIQIMVYFSAAVLFGGFFLFFRRRPIHILILKVWFIAEIAYYIFNVSRSFLNQPNFGLAMPLLFFSTPNILSFLYLNSKSFRSANSDLLELRDQRDQMKMANKRMKLK